MDPLLRTRSVRAGVLGGLALGLADWAASGLTRTPGTLVLATLLGAGLAGGVAGVAGALLRRPQLGPGLVLAGGILLEGLSIASKDLHGSARTLACLLVVGLALAGLVCVLRLPEIRLHLGACIALPAGAWLAATLSSHPWGALAGTATPFAWWALHGKAKRARATLAWLALLACLAWAQLGHGASRTDPPDRQPGEPPGGERPSVVLLVVDTLRSDALDPRGPLAEFAAGGVEFRQCVSAAPWTLPAVSSLLTGLLPSQHGAVDVVTPLAEEVTTLAERLRAEGYATAAFTGGAFVGSAHRLDQGFEVFDSTCERRFASFGRRIPLVWRLAKNRYFPQRWLVRRVDEFVGLRGVLEAALGWSATAGPRPKLLLLHTYQVHDYYLYDPDTDDDVLAQHGHPSARFAGRLSVHPSELVGASASDLAHFERIYQARVRAVEQLFPELVAALGAHLGQDAIWIVTADHGEGFDAATGRVHHGGRLHEDLLRVPLILCAPGRLAPGKVVEDLVRSIDVLPTVLELVGLPLPDGLAGVSLLPALRGEQAFPGSAFAEERASGYDLLALRAQGWKWIRGPGHEELYRLDRDPRELEPLREAPPGVVQEEFDDFRRRYPARERRVEELDERTLEHLRALGYLGDGQPAVH